MSKENQSPHASISFTAHYTGEMWQKLGLSHPALATKKGKQLHKLVAPLEWFAQRFFGVTMNKTLTTRHSMIDARVEALITQHPNLQILEIAAGLSPRGWRFLQKHPQIHYAELDLPAMSALKQQRAENLPAPKPAFFAADLFSEELAAVFNTFDTKKPLLIISEGLINYFSLPMLGTLSQTLANQLAPFTKGMWITENYPYSNKASYNALVKTAAFSLRSITRSSFSFYFTQPNDITQFFTQHGFATANVYQPSQPHTAENAKHLGDTVWIVEMG